MAAMPARMWIQIDPTATLFQVYTWNVASVPAAMLLPACATCALGESLDIPIPVPAMTPGAAIYFGLAAGGVLHVATNDPASPQICPLTAPACVQDIFLTPGAGEWPIAIYTAGTGTIRSLWIGGPARPAIQFSGAAAAVLAAGCPGGYGVTTTPQSTRVVCN